MTEHKNELAQLARQRTENYFDAHRYCCSESIIVVINEGFGGGLSKEAATSLGTAFCGGMGGEGVCGSLSGAAAILGLLTESGQKNGLSKKKMRQMSKQLHDQFKKKYGSTSCQELTADYKNNKQAKMKSCQTITGYGAYLVTELLLEYRPELAGKADVEFLSGHDSRFKALLKKVKSAL